MHLYKYPFLNHKDATTGRKHEIYTLDVSINGKLATGAIDGRICLWDTNGLKNNNTYSILKIPLCSMTRHDGAITCVRFSPNGRFLASGSDDKLVLIWEIDDEKSKILKSNRDTMSLIGGDDLSMMGELEHWTVRKRLVAHDNDVQDMAWAPDGSILVTVGLDRSIVIWSGNTFEKIKRFDIHQSHVKGVTFDPAGKYFVTCSDDRTMRVFHYRKDGMSDSEMSFTVESVVREPFNKSPLSTYFRRCSWSPDGLYIAAPNGINDGVSANPIIKRGTWEMEVSLIGHRLPSEVCAFSPRLYDVGDEKVDTILISAGQDRTIALWSTNCTTPLCVVNEVSLKSITDIKWASNGLEVYLCSLDGDIIVIGFDDFEFGRILSWDETFNALNRYGKDRDIKFTESVSMMELETLAKRKFASTMESDNLNSNNNSRLHELMKGSSEGLKSSSENSSSAKINMLVGRSKKNPNKQLPSVRQATEVNSSKKINNLNVSNQKVTITKNGKKRVTPMLISAASTSPEKEDEKKIVKKPNGNNSQKLTYISHPHPNLPKLGLPTLVSSLIQIPLSEIESNNSNANDAIDDIIEADSSSIKTSSRKRERRINNRHHDSTLKRHSNEIPSWIENNIINPMTMFGDKSEYDVQVEIKKINENKNEQTLEIRYQNSENKDFLKLPNAEHDVGEDNPFNEQFNSISQLVSKFDIQDSNKFDEHWNIFIYDKLSSIDESKFNNIQYWVLGFESGKLIVLSMNGRLILPTITIGSPVIKVIAKGNHLLAITDNGDLWTWEMFNEKYRGLFKCRIDCSSVAPIINQYSVRQEDENDKRRRKIEVNVGIERIELQSASKVFILLTNGDCFSWDGDLHCWIQLIDKSTWDQFTKPQLSSNEIIKQIISRKLGVSVIIRKLIRNSTVSQVVLTKPDLKGFNDQLKCINERL